MEQVKQDSGGPIEFFFGIPPSGRRTYYLTAWSPLGRHVDGYLRIGSDGQWFGDQLVLNLRKKT